MSFILIILFFCCKLNGFSQELIFPQDSIKILSKKQNFPLTDSLQIRQHIEYMKLKAYKKGYLAFSIDSIIKRDSMTTEVFCFIGKSYKRISIKIDQKNRKILREIGVSPKTIESTNPTPIAISQMIQGLLEQFETKGFPFARITFTDLNETPKGLLAQLEIYPGPLVKWNEIIITGEKFKLSPKYIANFLHIEKGDLYNQTQVDLIATRLKQVLFVRETKPAELLFTPDGANLYLYLETKPVSLFNGTVGLQQDPVKLNYYLSGDLRLKLQNAFKHGELFDLTWRSVQPKSPQLKILASYPFLFNTPFGLDGQFSLFKRDSSYLELKSSIGVTYFLSAGKTLTAFYKNEQSNLLKAGASNTNFGTTLNNSYGLAVKSQTIDYLPNPRNGFIWSLEAHIGSRKLTKDTVSNKYLIYGGRFSVEYYKSLGKRFVIKSALLSETFYTNSIQQNELLRFGGNLAQRGFLEDELLATFRSTLTIEPRFILDQNSYLFAFYDQSWYERNVTSYLRDAPLGFGAGISFGTNIGIFSLTYALGKQQQNPILFRDSKIHFGYVAYF